MDYLAPGLKVPRGDDEVLLDLIAIQRELINEQRLLLLALLVDDGEVVGVVVVDGGGDDDKSL